MNVILTLDPGACTGWALFDSCRRLVACGIDPLEHPLPHPERVVIEYPRIYPGGRTKNPNDIVMLALRAGELAGYFKTKYALAIEYITPQDWKGATPKDIQHARDWAKLTDQEKAIVDKSLKGVAVSKRHNALDGIGIGLWAVKR